MSASDYISGAEALDILGVKRQTLYAYVSRGWIRSLPQPGARVRLYSREDIEKAKARAHARAGHGAVAASAMNCGDPIIATRITEITPAGPRYRGRLAADLARSGLRFENVAELLWLGQWHEQPVSWKLETRPAELERHARAITFDERRPLLELFAPFLVAVGASRGSTAERVHDGTTLLEGRQAIQALVGCFGYLSPLRSYVPMQAGEPVARAVLRAAGLAPCAEHERALNAAMILLADHELSPATFSARVAASSGCELQNCLASAISINTGTRIGQIYERAEELLEGAASAAELLRRVGELSRQGLTVPGFTHPFYPEGDPRARDMLELARTMPGGRRLEHVFRFLYDAREQLELYARNEIAVVVLLQAIGLPRRSGSALFTLARIAGWVAHVLEQRLDPTMLRPRAKFVSA
jgi:citrate synthase